MTGRACCLRWTPFQPLPVTNTRHRHEKPAGRFVVGCLHACTIDLGCTHFYEIFIRRSFGRYLRAPRFACSTPLRFRKRWSRGRSSQMDIKDKSTPLPGMFGRRGFLTGVGATLIHATLAEYAWPRSVSARSFGDDPFTLGVASGDPTDRRGRVVDETGPEATGRGRRHAGRSIRPRPMADLERRAHAQDRPAGLGVGVPGARTLGARRSRGAAARALVLVSVHRRPRRKPGRPHADGARFPFPGQGALRVRFLSALRERPLLLASTHGAGESRLRRPPRGLHLRGAVDQHDQPSAPAGPRDHVARTITASATDSTSPIRICKPCTRRSPGS